MKRISLIIILFAIVCGNLKATDWSFFADTEFVASGDGTPARPYIISKPEQLAGLAVLLASEKYYADFYNKNYQLSADIDLDITPDGYSGHWDIPIGGSRLYNEGLSMPFQGTFDGDGFRITNMRVSLYFDNSYDFCGLFGRTEGAAIRNVIIEDVSVYCQVQNSYLGSLIGQASGTTIENCIVKKAYISTYDNYDLSDVVCGGLIGKAGGGTIVKNCSFSGTIYNSDGRNTYTGGFAGVCDGATFDKCFSEGLLAGIENTGGFIGYLGSGNNTIENCYSTCTISGTNNVGGFIGYTDNCMTKIKGCRSSGSVLGKNDVGGFIGFFKASGEITDCIAEVHVSGESEIGGFIGFFTGLFDYEISVSDCSSTGSVTGMRNRIGGFFGTCQFSENMNKFITRCYAEGSVFGYDNVGGFAGETSFRIFACFAYGDVKGNGNVGGFVGGCDGVVTDCYAVGSVKGNDIVGGFVGWNDDNAIVTDCYALGSVEGYRGVGGFGGLFESPVSNCFAGGTVFCENSKNYCGAFAGYIIPDINIEKCYFNKQTAGLANAAGVSPIDGIEGLTASKLTSGVLSGFSSDKWVFTEGYYPQLNVFAKSDNESIKLRSALSAVPLTLLNDMEMINDIKTIISLADKTSSGHLIEWIIDPAEKATVINNNLYAEKYGEWRTLTLRVGDAERKIKFRSDNSLMTTDILSLKINNVIVADHISSHYTYAFECGSDDKSVFVEITLGGYASTSAIAFTLYANQPQNITVSTTDGQTKTYTFVAEKRLSADIFVQRWNDVLAVNNNFMTNGGYHFTAYEWYKNGAKMSSDKGYIQEPKGLDKSAKYTVNLTTQQGDKISTCPAEISDEQTKATVYPNPVQRGQTARVETGITTNAVMQLFDVAGNIITKQTMQNPISEIIAPDTQGTYILQITENGESQSIKIVVE